MGTVPKYWLFLGLVSLLSAPCLADQIILDTGYEIRGIILEETENEITFLSATSGRFVLQKNLLLEIIRESEEENRAITEEIEKAKAEAEKREQERRNRIAEKLKEGYVIYQERLVRPEEKERLDKQERLEEEKSKARKAAQEKRALAIAERGTEYFNKGREFYEKALGAADEVERWEVLSDHWPSVCPRCGAKLSSWSYQVHLFEAEISYWEKKLQRFRKEAEHWLKKALQLYQEALKLDPSLGTAETYDLKTKIEETGRLMELNK